MTANRRPGVFRKMVRGISSMTLLVLLFLLVLFQFPLLTMTLMIVVTIPFLWRLLPRAETSGETNP